LPSFSDKKKKPEKEEFSSATFKKKEKETAKLPTTRNPRKKKGI
jgi:hypothetical protein